MALKPIRALFMTLLLTTSMFFGVTGTAEAHDQMPCHWEVVGDRSYCDNHVTQPGDPVSDQCFGPHNGEYAKYTAEFNDGSLNIGYIQLLYNGKDACRTVAAVIVMNGGIPAGSNCYVKVERTSDGQAYRVGASPNGAAFTASLYDADVESYAWGYCKWGSNGPAYTAQTGRWLT
ncbi:hypothetical protein [Streptosporangium carneum]|uniref:Secreted protein n=1 Tax=Streptosporangium carneum TaxID=47481 RepID=A0A9W6MIA9_9ACTN|nr:hypothetical protein [Streptosporangium carneum]GLK15191.1 hypothetical protein GCM10017600_86040 [Streptosporangium carneum]